MEIKSAICPRCGSAIDPALGDLFAILSLGIILGVFLGFWFYGVLDMAGRDRKLRKKGQGPEHIVPRLAKDALGDSWAHLPDGWRHDILVAVLDAQNGGEKEMRRAAREMYRSLRAAASVSED